MRIDRMLAIVITLLNRERISARDLAERFEVSIRTVYRDIEAINQAGIPVVSVSGKGGGFGIMDHYKISRQLLRMTDISAILSALRSVNTTLKSRELDASIEKVQALLPRRGPGKEMAQLEQVILDLHPWGIGEKFQQRLQLIYQGITESRLLQFRYCDTRGCESVRRVEPMTLVFRGFSWYLFGYCRNRKDYRIFKVTRLRQCLLCEEWFQRRDECFPGMTSPGEKKLRILDLVMKFPPESRPIVEDRFDEEMIGSDPEGNLIVKVSFADEPWVYGYILSFGELVEIVEPESVKRELWKTARAIAERYQPVPQDTEKRKMQ